jgi:RimJ/RimL family protein N-acetyltransferase
MSVLYGERVRLRAVEREDLPKFHEWVNDPEVTRGLTLYLPMSMVDEENWFNGVAQRDPNNRPWAVEIHSGEGWRMIGNCAVFDIEWIHRSGELGIMLGEKAEWNKGYGTEVMRLLQNHCFGTLNLHRVFLRVYAQNGRALRAYEKAGFVTEGCLRDAVYKHGKYDNVVLMSVLRSEWTAREEER